MSGAQEQHEAALEDLHRTYQRIMFRDAALITSLRERVQRLEEAVRSALKVQYEQR